MLLLIIFSLCNIIIIFSEFGVNVRPPSPQNDSDGPSHQPECPVIVSEPLYLRTKHQSNFLEGFRNTLRRAKSEAPEVEANTHLCRRWSDAHPVRLHTPPH